VPVSAFAATSSAAGFPAAAGDRGVLASPFAAATGGGGGGGHDFQRPGSGGAAAGAVARRQAPTIQGLLHISDRAPARTVATPMLFPGGAAIMQTSVGGMRFSQPQQGGRV